MVERNLKTLMSLCGKLRFRIPEEQQQEFEREILKDNFDRLRVVSIVAFLIEGVLYLIQSLLLNTGPIILAFLVASVFLMPIIWYVRANIGTIDMGVAKAVQYAYCLACLLFGCAVALVCQSTTDLSYVYIMVVFALTAFLHLLPLGSAVLLFLVYLGFIILLPQFQTNPDIVFISRVNTLVLNLLAWLQARIMLGMKLSSFLNQGLLHEKNKVLEDMVLKDPMTGLLNHKAVFQRLKEELGRSKRIGYPLSLMIMDIDDFKKINDRFGHLMGDRVILAVSDVIVSSVRSSDIAGRYGGDEFVIILPDTDVDGAWDICERIRGKIRTMQFDNDMKVTLSGGIGHYVGGSEEEMVQITDLGLYKAKRLGKDQFVVSPTMSSTV